MGLSSRQGGLRHAVCEMRMEAGISSRLRKVRDAEGEECTVNFESSKRKGVGC